MGIHLWNILQGVYGYVFVKHSSRWVCMFVQHSSRWVCMLVDHSSRWECMFVEHSFRWVSIYGIFFKECMYLYIGSFRMISVHVSRSFFKMVCTCMFVEHSFRWYVFVKHYSRWVSIYGIVFKMCIHLWNSIQDGNPFME